MPQGVPDPVAVLRGHSGEVQALEFDASERNLITGDAYGEVKVWDLQHLRPVFSRRLHPPTVGVLSLHLLPRQRQLLTQGRDGSAHLWALDSSMQPSEQPVRSFCKDAFSFCRCSVLHLEQQQQQQQPSACSADAHQAKAGPEGQQQAGSPDVVTELLRTEQEAQGSSAGQVAADAQVSEAGAEADTAHRAAAAGVADLSQQQSASRLRQQQHLAGLPPALQHKCTALDKTQQGVQQSMHPAAPALLAMADDQAQDPEVSCLACGQRLAYLQQSLVPGSPKLGMVLSVALYMRPDCKQSIYLAAGYEEGSLVIWDLAAAAAAATAAAPGAAAAAAASAAGAPPLAYRKLISEPVMAVAMDPGGAGGVCGAAEDKLVIFSVDYAAGSIGVRHTIDLKRQGINDVAVRQDGRILATAGWDGRVRVYKLRSGKPLAVLKYHSQAVAALTFSPRSMQLATAARDGTVALWDVFQPGSS